MGRAISQGTARTAHPVSAIPLLKSIPLLRTIQPRLRLVALPGKCYAEGDPDLRDRNAQTLSGLESSSNTGCLR